MRLARRDGETKSGRLGGYLDLGTWLLELSNPNDCLVDRGHDSGQVGVAARVSQILGGYVDCHVLAHHVPSLSQRINWKTGHYDGGFGPMVEQYIGSVIEELRIERSSRRALLPLSDTLRSKQDVDYPSLFAVSFTAGVSDLSVVGYTRSLDIDYLDIDYAILASLQGLVGRELSLLSSEAFLCVGALHTHAVSVKTARQASVKGSHQSLPSLDVGREALQDDLRRLRELEQKRTQMCIEGRPVADMRLRSTSHFADWLDSELLASHGFHHESPHKFAS